MRQKTNDRMTSGFTLMEVAIVVVVIGLVIGGVITGQDLIKSGGIRSTVAQISEIDQGIQAFHDKYDAFPGDMPNATNYWPTAVDGNGNGKIEYIANGHCAWRNYMVDEPDCEMYNGERNQLFIQLGLAGMGPTYDNSIIPGQGLPAIKLHPNAGMFVAGRWTLDGTSNMSIENYAHDSMYLAMIVCDATKLNVDSQFNDCAIFTAEEAANIDHKLDDGKPLSGVVLAHSFNTTCLANGTDYNVSLPTVACNLLYSLRQ